MVVGKKCVSGGKTAGDSPVLDSFVAVKALQKPAHAISVPAAVPGRDRLAIVQMRRRPPKLL